MEAVLARRHKHKKPERRPGYEGKFSLTTRQVDNPYAPGESEIVAFNAAESNARTLRLDTAQTAAFEWIYRLYYRAGYFRQGAVDTTKEPVDGGGYADPLTEGAVAAFRELAQIATAIGANEYRLVKITCLSGKSYRDVAGIMFGEPNHAQILQATWAVKEAYSKLTVHLGLAGTPTHFARLRAYMDERPGDRPELRQRNTA